MPHRTERMKARLRPKTANSPADNRTSEIVIWHVRELPFLASSASPTLPHYQIHRLRRLQDTRTFDGLKMATAHAALEVTGNAHRSEEHTSELQSLRHLVCR